MTRTRLLAFPVLAALMVGASSLAQAQTAPAAPDCVMAGEYRDLTFLRQLKIGAAEYVNPSLIKTSALAYKYEPHSLAKKVAVDSVIKALLAGELAVANHSNSGYRVYTADTEEFDTVLADLKKGGSWEETKGLDKVLFVAPVDVLYGVPAEGSIVSWDADKNKLPLTGLPADCPPKAH